MSSAILLAAIVAIWACALVPRWVRRAHEAALKQQAREGFETDEAYPVVEGYPADPGDDETYEETYQAQAYQAIDDEAQYDEAEYDEAEYDEAEIACQAETNYPLADDETRDVTEPDEPAARSAAASATVRTQPADRPQGRQPALPPVPPGDLRGVAQQRPRRDTRPALGPDRPLPDHRDRDRDLDHGTEAEHRQIAEAIRSRQATVADSQMRHHVEQALRSVERIAKVEADS